MNQGTPRQVKNEPPCLSCTATGTGFLIGDHLLQREGAPSSPSQRPCASPMGLSSSVSTDVGIIWPVGRCESAILRPGSTRPHSSFGEGSALSAQQSSNIVP